MSFQIHLGDSLAWLKTLPDNSVDSVVCDPPYGLKFMGSKWDADVPGVDVWAECLRVLKPGGHLLAFAGTRTQHRMATRIEDAGFEIRDMIAWVFSSGFPKSHNVGKKIDQTVGAEDSSEKFRGFGTALKPALEPITLARKPFTGTVAQNVMTHGTGAINIDGCRVGTGEDRACPSESGLTAIWGAASKRIPRPTGARWPANFILSYPEDEYILSAIATTEQRAELSRWLHANT